MTAMAKNPVASFLAGLVNVFWYGAMVLLALAIVLLVVSPWIGTHDLKVDLRIPVALSVNATTHPVIARSQDVSGARLEELRGSLRFVPLNRRVVAGSAAVLIAAISLIAWVLHQLRSVFRTLRDGRPFVAANATRLRNIGWAVIAGETLRTALALMENSYAAGHFAVSGLTFEVRPDYDALTLISGLIILAIAEVFRAGTRLDEEQSLTV
jgi:hypothetical protein